MKAQTPRQERVAPQEIAETTEGRREALFSRIVRRFGRGDALATRTRFVPVFNAVYSAAYKLPCFQQFAMQLCRTLDDADTAKQNRSALFLAAEESKCACDKPNERPKHNLCKPSFYKFIRISLQNLYCKHKNIAFMFFVNTQTVQQIHQIFIY